VGRGPHGTIASGAGTIVSGGPLHSPLNFSESPCEGLAAVALCAAAGLRAAGSLCEAGSSLTGDLPAVRLLQRVGSPWGFVGLVFAMMINK